MTVQTTKSTLLILLNVGIFSTLIGMNVTFAEEQTNAIYDPIVVQYIKDLTSQPGKNIQEKTIDGKTVTVITNTRQITENNYSVKTTTNVDGEQIMTEIFNITVHDDGIYELVNLNFGIHETFTDVSYGAGSGDSDYRGARIDLYDREIGSPNALRLYDNYSACSMVNRAMFSATVKPNLIDVNWEANPFYLHWCLIAHQFMSGDIQFGTQHYYIDGQTERRGYHAFTNGHSGTTQYSVEADFVYGAW